MHLPSSRYKLTLLGRAVFLIVLELLANVTFWVVAGVLFIGKRGDGDQDESAGGSLLNLAVLAWVCISF